MSSENKSLKNSVVLSYGKLREAAHNKVRLEKKNTVLSNRMVEMEESRDAHKSSKEAEEQARQKCVGLLSAESKKKQDSDRKLQELQVKRILHSHRHRSRPWPRLGLAQAWPQALNKSILIYRFCPEKRPWDV